MGGCMFHVKHPIELLETAPGVWQPTLFRLAGLKHTEKWQRNVSRETLLSDAELFKDSIQHLFGGCLPNQLSESPQCRVDFEGNKIKRGPLIQSFQRIGEIIPYLSESSLMADVCHNQVLWRCPHFSVK